MGPWRGQTQHPVPELTHCAGHVGPLMSEKRYERA